MEGPDDFLEVAVKPGGFLGIPPELRTVPDKVGQTRLQEISGFFAAFYHI